MTMMADQSEPMDSPPVVPPIERERNHLEPQPAVCRDPKMAEKLIEHDFTLSQAVHFKERAEYWKNRALLAERIVGHYMHGLTQAKWSWDELLKANAAVIEPDGRGGFTGRVES